MITIGLVTYNRPEYLRECVNSIISQTFKNWHLIISNDYTKKDVTFESLGIDQDQRIRIYNQKINIGEISNLNFLLAHSKTEFFTWLCDDDLFHVNFLEYAVNALLGAHESKVVAFYSNYGVGEKYNIFNSIKDEKHNNSLQILCSKQFIENYLLKILPLIGCYGVVRTDCLKKIGGFKSLGNSFGPYSDTLIPILLSTFGNIAYHNARLVFLRTHQTSISFTSTDFDGYTSAEEDFIKELKLFYEASPNSIDFKAAIGRACIWFSDNHFTVLMRARKSSTIDVYLKYFRHQYSVTFPRLNTYWKIKLLIHVLIFCTSNIIRSINRKVRHL